ncbi:MAG TPA: hypothetical protein VH740_13255 [Vicinamibacterales bacterium]
MDDTANWEFAAVVAAVCIGLGGLLLFTLLGAIGAWRVHEAASNAAAQAARAAAAIEELARSMMFAPAAPDAPAPAPPDAAGSRLAETAAELERLRGEAAELLRQQESLSDTVRDLVQSGVLRSDQSSEQLRQLEQTLRRVEEQLVRITTPRPR